MEKKDWLNEKVITGETKGEAIDRYRRMVCSDDWEKLSLAERRDRINRFRAGWK